MMNSIQSRIPRNLVAACAVVITMIHFQSANAVDRFWQGDTSSNYSLNANWDTITGGTLSPRASQGERAVVGTDNPSGARNSDSAPFGSPMITANTLGPGGLALGLRAIDYDDLDFDGLTNDFIFEPAPPAASLVGRLTIATGGTLTTAVGLGGADLVGADGRTLVGVHGRGFLTMTGGTLNTLGLVVAGESNAFVGTSTSLVDLSNASSNPADPDTVVNITGTSGLQGLATFSRRLKITGPNVNFNSTRNLRLEPTNSYTAVINNATTHSPLKTGAAAIVNGALNVEFSGAGATHSLGQTWTLVDATSGLSGGFNNLGVTGDVPVSGLVSAPPVGAVYRTQRAAGPAGHTLLNLVYDRVLVLNVNRDTGEMRITNPLGGSIVIDGYSINSPVAGSLLTSYKGISGAPAGDTGWAKPPSLTFNGLAELKQTGSFNTSGIGASGISLGTGFDKFAVASHVTDIGVNGQDLVFRYNDPVAGPIYGQVQYTGAAFENNLVLTVNSGTGAATLKNETLQSLSFDGYSILSSTGGLSAAWAGIGGQWEKTAGTPGALSETNPHGPLTLAAGASVSLGNIGAFGSAAAQAGVSLQFIRQVPGGSSVGDYNGNGAVDAADYTVWRDHLGQTFALTNEDPTATPGTVTIEDYNIWKANFGAAGGGLVGEDTFRVGVVRFVSGPGAGGGSAVPEPVSGSMMIVGLAGLLGMHRRSRRNEFNHFSKMFETPVRRGSINMIRPIGFCAAGLIAVIVAAAPAKAVTQGIPLANGNFELPGPAGGKVIAFDNTGLPIPGIIPGWTFTGGAGGAGEVNPGVGNELFGDNVPGDSGTEGGGNPGNEMLLSTVDGRAFQTSTFNVMNVPATQKYQLGFDAHNIFTPTGMAQLTARLYYVDTSSVKQTLGTALATPALAGFQRFTIDVVGGSAALTPAITRPIGVEFDTTSREFDATVVQSWAGVDNVVLQIVGTTPGDLNGDGLVNITDYRVIRDRLQTSSLYQADGELTGDGKVDLNDFRAWTKIAGPVPGGGSWASASVPEPSAMGLGMLAVLAVAAGSRNFSRMSTRRLSRASAVAIASLAALLLASESKAVQLAYEPFKIGPSPANGEYTVTTVVDNVQVNPLVGQNPATSPTNFFTGPWIIGSAGGAVQAGSLHYLGTGATDTTGSVNGFGRTERALSTPWDDTTNGTFYLGYQVNFGSTPDGNMGYRAVEFFPPGVTPGENRVGDIGYNQFNGTLGPAQQAANTAKIQFNIGAAQIVDGAPDSYNLDGTTHLMVLKFVLSSAANSDSVSLFLDPTSSIEPELPNTSASGLNFQLGSFGYASFGNGAGPTTVLDEIKVGTTFADVVPTFPVPGDTNGDGDVDLDDYQAIFNNFLKTGVTTAQGDVALSNGRQGADGRVDLGDFYLWKTMYPFPGAGAGSLAGGNVPEPSSGMLILAAVAGVVGIGRRSRLCAA